MSECFYIIGNAYAGKSTLVKALSARHHGIACEENYHNAVVDRLDAKEFPNLCYTRDLKDWHDFVRRSPEVYAAWIQGASRECELLELKILEGLKDQDTKVFVDTNISIETLQRIADKDHVLVMLADPKISVDRFFERSDREKQFLYRLMMEEPDPEASIANFRECLRRINSRESYETFLHSGFPVLLRDDHRQVEETLRLAEGMLQLFPVGFSAGDLTVRRLEAQDLSHMLRWMTDPRVLEFYEGRDIHFTEITLAEHFLSPLENGFSLILEYQEIPIGYAQVYQLVGEELSEYAYSDDPRMVFAMDLFIGDPAYWNRGIGSFFVDQMCKYMKENFFARVMLLDPRQCNHRAIRAYEKAGFRIVKPLPEHELFEGHRQDCWLMERTL